jgi:hypothetical protein
VAYGTLQILDTIGARKAAASDYLNLYDEAELYLHIEAYLAAHNQIMMDMMADLVVPVGDRRFITWGDVDAVDMIDGDEYSRPDVQKSQESPTGLGVPLYLKQVAWGVSRLFMMNKTVGDLDQLLTNITDADKRDILKTIRRTLFNPTNTTNYVDRRTDRASFSTTFPLRSFLNADSASIPKSPYGASFTASTHTHFLGYASGSFVVGDLDVGIDTVNEHYLSGTPRIYIAKNLEATVRAFSGFYPYYDARLRVGMDTTAALIQNLDMTNVEDRAIGVYKAAEVFVKYWIPSSYIFFYNASAPKPLGLRTRDAGQGNLHVAADMEIYPLRAQFMEREYGMAVIERANGACLLTTSSTYSAPSEWSL